MKVRYLQMGIVGNGELNEFMIDYLRSDDPLSPFLRIRRCKGVKRFVQTGSKPLLPNQWVLFLRVSYLGELKQPLQDSFDFFSADQGTKVSEELYQNGGNF